MKRYNKSTFSVMMLLAACLTFGLVGTSWAHPDIPLLDAAGAPVPDTGIAAAPVFSYKTTCGACHGDAAYPALLGYDEIEKHSFHAQLGANQMAEFDPANAKPWAVQSPGHFGKW
jgi:mono/diheme cytochrome c family protein